LLTKQAQLNAALDLDKGERQVAQEEAGDPAGSDDVNAPDENSNDAEVQETNKPP
jgi:hypothetical protein